MTIDVRVFRNEAEVARRIYQLLGCELGIRSRSATPCFLYSFAGPSFAAIFCMIQLPAPVVNFHLGGKQPKRVGVMAKTELKTDTANWVLRAAAILGVLYGFGFLLMPYSMFQLSGDPGVPTNPGWVRWAGGFVLGIAIGPWLASEGWIKEQPFIAGLAAAFTLSGLALLYGVVSGEYAGAAWFIWMPIVILAVLAPTMWWLATK